MSHRKLLRGLRLTLLGLLLLYFGSLAFTGRQGFFAHPSRMEVTMPNGRLSAADSTKLDSLLAADPSTRHLRRLLSADKRPPN